MEMWRRGDEDVVTGFGDRTPFQPLTATYIP